MTFKKQNRFLGLTKICALLLYIPFFVVQCFFNYATSPHHKSANLQSNNQPVGLSKQACKIFQGDKSNDKEVKVNLSKRFQPENGPGCNCLIIQVPVYFAPERVFNTNSNPHLPSAYLLSNALRGPPLFA